MRLLGFGAVLTLSLVAVAPGQEKKTVSLRDVKYDGLKDVILKNRGKVVYVDFWYNT
ncbi:MAG: hypothetical protein U0793_08965 [Gemmataceae bacterium]